MTTRGSSRLSLGVFITISLGIGLGPALVPVHAQDGGTPDLGTVTTIDVPGSINTFPFGINASGVIVGRYLGAEHHSRVVRTATDEVCTVDYPGTSFAMAGVTNVCVVDVPGANFTVASGINAQGDISGWYTVAGSAVRHGFVLNAGELTPLFFDPPGSVFTSAVGINERGDIVGAYCDSAIPCGITLTGTHGFLLRGGEFTTIDISGIVGVTVTAKSAAGINGRGEIVGSYADGTHFHGFLLSAWIYQPSNP